MRIASNASSSGFVIASARNRRARERGGIAQSLELPALRRERLDLRGVENRQTEVSNFGFDVGVRHRVGETSDRMLDVDLEPRSIAKRYRDVRGVFRNG